MCNKPCNSTCKSCSQTDGVCIICKDEFYGDQCEKQCNPGCKYTTCHISDGWCECKPRHNQIKGTQCLPCPENCLNSCKQSLYCDSCKDGYYGDFCNVTCSPYCKDDKCDRDGSCTCKPGAAFTGCCPENCQGGCDNSSVCKTCMAGYYGSYCNETCSNCMNSKCNQLIIVCE